MYISKIKDMLIDDQCFFTPRGIAIAQKALLLCKYAYTKMIKGIVAQTLK